MNRLAALAASLLLSSAVLAQNPNYTLAVTDAMVYATGDTAVIGVELENLQPVDAWSFAVCYDQSVVQAQFLLPGAALPPNPNFYSEEIGAGFIRQFCVLGFLSPATLPPTAGNTQQLLSVSFQAVGQVGEFTGLTLCDAGVPATDVVLSVGATQVTPTESNGTFEIGTPVVLDSFQRGDCDNNGSFNLADIVHLLGYLFPVAMPNTLDCFDACDTDDDVGLNLNDAVVGLTALFGQPTTTPLAQPYLQCGADPTPDGLTCAAFGACP